MDTRDDETAPETTDRRLKVPGLSRRDFMKAVSGAGFAAAVLRYGLGDSYAWAAGPGNVAGGTSTLGTPPSYIPEQVHLTWGADPSTEVTVSWASLSPQNGPTVTLVPPTGTQLLVERSYTDGLSGETVYCYHVTLSGLTPNTPYSYTVSDIVDTTATFTSSFTTANQGRVAFAFTSFGDLGTPGAGAAYVLADGSTIYSTTYSESQWNAYNAVGEVEALANTAGLMPPLFHLLNGDLCYGDKETINSSGQTGTGTTGVQPSPEVWRDFALNVQRSAANRPWMPCVGNHEVELDNGPYGLNSYNTRFMLPSNGSPSFGGSYYAFQVGSVLFISLDANDVCYQGAGAYNVAGVATKDSAGKPVGATGYQNNQYYTGTFTTNADGTLAPGGTTPNAQTVWLESTLAAARSNTNIDWIVVQMHQCALSSSTDNGCDAGIRQAWVPLFDKYQVDLVVNGHDHDYDRSYPVRGFTANKGTSTFTGGSVWQVPGNQLAGQSPVTLTGTSGNTVNTFTPNVVSGDTTSPFNTSLGTVYLTLGGGGTNKRDNTYGGTTANVTTFTQIRTGTKPTPDATEPCAWSAAQDKTDAYGIAYFLVNPGTTPGGNTTITVTYYHAPTQVTTSSVTGGTQDVPAPSYTALETFELVRPRSDGPTSALPEFPTPVVGVGAALAVGGALVLGQHLKERALVRSAQLVEVGDLH